MVEDATEGVLSTEWEEEEEYDALDVVGLTRSDVTEVVGLEATNSPEVV